MAYSPNINTKSTEKINPAHGKASTPKSRINANFAAVMEKEQNSSNAKNPLAAQKGAPVDAVPKRDAQVSGQAKARRPVVARLPEAGIPLNNTVLAGRSPNEMLRMQTFNRAQTDLQRTRAINGFMQGASGNSLDLARDMNMAASLRTIAAAGNGAGFALTSSDFIHTRPNISRADRVRRRNSGFSDAGIGKLSARFESGGDGIAAIGYDRNGGTSYGKYQIASRVGSMNSFLSFLDGEAPDLSRRLRRCGPANTGGRSGRMPSEWKAIAREQPERFEKLQESFIRQTHYKPALDAIEQRTSLDASSLSPAMREVIWSTAVQHGPTGAARIFDQADNMSGNAEDAGYERKLISNVYALRAGQFGSSSHQVRDAVRNRFRQEKQLALNMLEGQSRASMA